MSNFEDKCLLGLIGATALAAIALAIPGLVYLGLIAFILPGVLMIISAPIALYGWLFALPYGVLRTIGVTWWMAALIALPVPLTFGFALPAQSNAETRSALARAVAADIRPAKPLAIGGTVALAYVYKSGGGQEKDSGCDDLCLRLLYNGDAKIVYLGQPGGPGVAFAIERRAVCPQFIFSDRLFKWHNWPHRAAGTENSVSPPAGLKEIVEARIAGGECLAPVSSNVRPDWTIERTYLPRGKIRFGWSMAPDELQGERITVYRHDGSTKRPVGRFTNATTSALLSPLLPTLVSTTANSGWAWARTTIGKTRWDWDSVTVLRRFVAFNAELPEGISPARMRELLAAALADPRRMRDDAGLLLANSVMADITLNGPKKGDAALLAKAIADDRFMKIEPNHKLAEKLGTDYAMIVDSAIARLGRLPVSGTNNVPHDELGRIIAAIPEEWFAPPPQSVVKLLRDPVIAARARRIIGQLDAGGAAAVPLLTEIIISGAERVSSIEALQKARIETEGINAAVAALCRIGPAARSALGPIIAMKQKLNNTGDRWVNPNPGRYMALWRGKEVNDGFVVTLVSLGIPISEFRPPDNPSSKVNGSWQGNIMHSVKDHDCAL